MVGTKHGDTVKIRYTANKAFGPYREEMVMEVGRSQLPGHVTAEAGRLDRGDVGRQGSDF